ncbi:MAG: bifunctional glycosyltransferase/CDP-glycerol:glycerophosphate glycerophosphotransferase [Brevibacterium aurantiacum]|uniref:bifunctional glycosyltransferase/CDP-glycerol:glycerophosphate glycerophosphotransferase n=1 Tax=Brevibacterium aurantiacum TaxID=273384 RepID=UPI003F936F41
MDYQFTVLVAIYNVEEYIRAFLESLEHQSYPLSKIEIVAVDDGSLDESAEIFEAWARGRPNVKFVSQSNAGPGAARATALALATGQWITVADPDDILDKDYFSAVSKFIQRDAEQRSSILSTRVYILNDSTGDFRDIHPLGKKFRFGDRMAALSNEPEAFQLGATAFFRASVLREHDLTYDPDIRPTFEDAHLIGRYLNKFREPIVGLVSNAHYYYRKRSNQGSLVQSSWSTTDRFLNTPRRGYLDMLSQVSDNGSTPQWAQYMVLYDLIWFFKEDQNMNSKVAWLDVESREEFLQIVETIMSYIDESTLLEFSCNPMPWILRQCLLVRFGRTSADQIRLYKWSRDPEGFVRFSLLYYGDRPKVEIYSDGSAVEPSNVNYRNHFYFGQKFMTEESLSVPGNEIAVFADGAPLRPSRFINPVWNRPNIERNPSLIPDESNPRSKRTALPNRLRTRYKVRSLTTSRSVVSLAAEKARSRLGEWFAKPVKVRELSKTSSTKQYITSEATKRVYSGSWVVMDRPHAADDNGEHFYRYLSQNHSDIDAYFILSPDSKDWKRLKSEGFRLLEYGSKEAHAASIHAKYRISSDATADVMYSAPRGIFGEPSGKFIFLQHGVIMNDLSRWLNPKNIDLIITTTLAEYESFVGRSSLYRFPQQNVALTGLARYDSLLRRSETTHTSSLLVMPTWRMDVRDLLAGTEVEARVSQFTNTEYGRRWLEFLRSDDLNHLCAEAGLTVDLVIHPSLDSLLPDIELPPHVQRVDLRRESFQEVIARAGLFITDYSSLTFDAAYLRTPTIYYQFDRDEVFSGGHSIREGYFSYEMDGFGPVVTEYPDLIDSIQRLTKDNSDLKLSISNRIESTFKWIDKANCERIFESIMQLNES